MELSRIEALQQLDECFLVFKIVAILGPRQVGKTTLARQFAGRRAGSVRIFDLEDPRDLDQLADPMLALARLEGLVILDEIQLAPQVLPALRVLHDRPDNRARFLLLGSASPDLLRESSEGLAGRIGHLELGGLSLSELGVAEASRLWLRGGYPRSFLAADEEASASWREALIRSYLERDLSATGLRATPQQLRRFWTMLAHYHGQTWNASELARAFGVARSTVERWLDKLEALFLLRRLPPWTINIGKRVVRSQKVYICDTGVLHSLLGIESHEDLLRNPKVGASWEGFALEAVVARLGARRRDCHFYATHAGAELDLFVLQGNERLGFEFKRSSAPKTTKSMHVTRKDLGLERLDVVHAGSETYPMAEGIRALALERIFEDLAPL